MDDDRSKTLSYDEFRKGIHDFGLAVTDEVCCTLKQICPKSSPMPNLACVHFPLVQSLCHKIKKRSNIQKEAMCNINLDAGSILKQSKRIANANAYK